MLHKIDLETGLFVEDVILDTVPVLDDGTPDPAYIVTPCPDGFYWPCWDGEQWVEGGQTPEPVEPELTELEKLKLRQDATENAVLFLMDMNMGGVL